MAAVVAPCLGQVCNLFVGHYLPSFGIWIRIHLAIKTRVFHFWKSFVWLAMPRNLFGQDFDFPKFNLALLFNQWFVKTNESVKSRTCIGILICCKFEPNTKNMTKFYPEPRFILGVRMREGLTWKQGIEQVQIPLIYYMGNLNEWSEFRRLRYYVN